MGAAATRLYMPERFTRDLAVMVQAADAAAARRKLEDAGYRYRAELSIGGSAWSAPDGFPVDVIEASQPWSAQSISEAQSYRDAHGAPILPLPFLALMNYEAGRAQDIADITRILGQATSEQLAAVFAVFARWLPGEEADLGSLVRLGQLEFEDRSRRDSDSG